MVGRLTHRGPDGEGFHLAPGIGLGIRRLSIIDLETGAQPISSEDGSVTVVCNGEIYNAPELRNELSAIGHRFRSRSDIEVIVHLYEEYGVQCLDRLRGMFGFALWDASRRRLMLARDRLGIKPLFYAVGRDGLLFGSELKAILAGSNLERTIDVHALKDLLTLGFVLSPKTLFRNIRRLQAGHYLLYHEGSFSVHRYWNLRFPATDDHQPLWTQREWAQALRDKLAESVNIHLRSDVPVGAWLSGGIDSSGIVSLMCEQTPRPVPTFSLAYDDPSYDEVTCARTLKDFGRYDLSHREARFSVRDFELLPKAVWHCEDPFGFGVEMARMRLSQTTSRHVKVVLTGEGADEIFGGYSWFKADRFLRPLTAHCGRVCSFLGRRRWVSRRWPQTGRTLRAPAPMTLTRYKRIIDSGAAEFHESLFSEGLKQELSVEGDPDDHGSLPDDFSRWDPFVQLQFLEMTVRLPDYVTRHLDSTSMAYGLEARVPFLDHELVEFCAGIPPGLKMRWRTEKYILREALRRDLPREIIRRKKRGMAAPYGQWMRALPPFAMEMLAEKKLREKGYFSPPMVSRMLLEHREGTTNHARSLMGILGVQLWDDLFVRGCQPS